MSSIETVNVHDMDKNFNLIENPTERVSAQVCKLVMDEVERIASSISDHHLSVIAATVATNLVVNYYGLPLRELSKELALKKMDHIADMVAKMIKDGARTVIK
jgi:hypothetical protein